MQAGFLGLWGYAASADSRAVEVPPIFRHAGRSPVSRPGGLNGVAVEGRIGIMHKHGETAAPPPDIPGFPKGWRDEIKADLAAQVEAGGTLYGVRSDGAYIARTREGDRVLIAPERKSA